MIAHGSNERIDFQMAISQVEEQQLRAERLLNTGQKAEAPCGKHQLCPTILSLANTAGSVIYF